MTDSDLFARRWSAITDRLVADGADALVLSAGFDMVYLTGYVARPSERLTAFVGRPKTADTPTIIAPQIELPHLIGHTNWAVQGWTDSQDPIAMVIDQLQGANRVLVSDEMPSVHLLRLQDRLPEATFVSLSDSLGGLRSVKSKDEMQSLQAVGALANDVAAQIQRGEMPLVGRTEIEIADDVIARMLAVGHEQMEFCIVASGPNSASPHHNPTDRVVQPNEIVLFDFGGKYQGYCSDITRCVFTGTITPEIASAYATLKHAQQVAFETARPGATVGDVDDAARSIITEAGYGENFIHRTGHGIGTEVHEQPYVKSGNDELIQVGHAFSIEPGIYLDGKWGIRLEDIVVIADDDGAVRCSMTNHDLVEVSV